MADTSVETGHEAVLARCTLEPWGTPLLAEARTDCARRVNRLVWAYSRLDGMADRRYGRRGAQGWQTAAIGPADLLGAPFLGSKLTADSVSADVRLALCQVLSHMPSYL